MRKLILALIIRYEAKVFVFACLMLSLFLHGQQSLNQPEVSEFCVSDLEKAIENNVSMIKGKLLWKDAFDTVKMQEEIQLKEWRLLIGRNKKGLSAVNITDNFSNVSHPEGFFQTNMSGLTKDPLGWSIEDLVEKYGGVDHDYCAGPFAVSDPNEPKHTVLVLATKNWLNFYFLKITKNDKGKEMRTVSFAEVKLSDLEIERKPLLAFDIGRDEHEGHNNIIITDASWQDRVKKGLPTKAKLVRIYPEERNPNRQTILTIWQKELVVCDAPTRQYLVTNEEEGTGQKQLVASNIVIPVEEKTKDFVEQGHQPWRLDPVTVAASYLNLVSEDEIEKNCVLEANDGQKAIVVCNKGKKYTVHLEKLFKPDGYWTVTSVEIMEK